MSASESELLDTLFDELFPILRSLAGAGIEKSLAIMARHMPLEICGVPSGTSVFDWEVPPTWNCRSAILTGPDGRVICDLHASNLHVVNYSEPVDRTLRLDELQKHLHSLPHLPDAVPYVTSYYNRTWGFCLSQRQRDQLHDGEYHARIDSEFVDGRVPLAHSILPGETDREIVLTTYLCHPSMANNELSGPLVMLGLFNRVESWERRNHTFRFVLHPETIGSLCYLYHFGDHLMKHMDAGLVLTCVGGPGILSYQKTRRECANIDQLAQHWFDQGERIRLRAFSAEGGSDERQYCSPGFNLPMGQFARTIYGEYDGYHNSLDTKEFMGIDSLIKSIDEIERFLHELDDLGPWVNRSPFGEPQLGKRGLYPTLNSSSTREISSDAMFDGRVFLNRILSLLCYCDGTNNLSQIARRCGCSVRDLQPLVRRLHEEKLLEFKGGIS